MPEYHQPYDKSSKWLIEHHGDSLLRLGGLREPFTWRPLPAEVVQPRQLPDGLLEVQLPGEAEADLFLLEIATYPERRLLDQVSRGLMLVHLDRRVVPEVLVLLLRPRGRLRLSQGRWPSRRGWTHWQARWRVVELWKVPADELLAEQDVGLIPWVPLTQFAGPPAPILQHCRDRIDQQAPPEERANLLAVIQVLTKLRYNDLRLLSILGGRQAMIESPLIRELLTERSCEVRCQDILNILEERFGPVGEDITALLRAIHDDAKLRELVRLAARCPELASFRQAMEA
jgi:hypothetical protein